MVSLDIDGDGISGNTPPRLRGHERRSWLAFGLWLYTIIAAVGILATGIASLLEPHSRESGLILTLAGAALGAVAWHRSRAALAQVNAAGHAAEAADVSGESAGPHRSAFASRATIRPERA